MTTGVAGVADRVDPRQVVNTLKKTINWNDGAAAAAQPFANYLPQGAFLTRVMVEVVTPFNGATPNVTVGTVGAAYNNIVAAADVNWGVAGVYDVTRGLGRALANAGPVLPNAVWNSAGGGPSAGQAIIVMEYEGGWQS